jgi:hypothetical protein
MRLGFHEFGRVERREPIGRISGRHNHLRTLLLQVATMDALMLRSLHRENVAGSSNVRVEAELITDGQQDRRIEQAIASRLSIEPWLSSSGGRLLSDRPASDVSRSYCRPALRLRISEPSRPSQRMD